MLGVGRNVGTVAPQGLVPAPGRAVSVRVRTSRAGDAPQIARLYFDTVRRVDARDCDPDRLAAWAPRVYDDGFWHRRRRRYEVYVAEVEGAVVGSAKLSPAGAIDCFYVHHAWQGRGVGRVLLRHLEARARGHGLHRLEADVSVAAELFFSRLGFKTEHRQTKIYHNRSFRQLVMQKRI